MDSSPLMIHAPLAQPSTPMPAAPFLQENGLEIHIGPNSMPVQIVINPALKAATIEFRDMSGKIAVIDLKDGTILTRRREQKVVAA